MGTGNDDSTAATRMSAASAMRRRAEAMIAAATPAATMARSPEEREHLFHELQVHQIELELQNEELRRIQEELELARARYFDLYNLAPVSYIMLSAQGVIQEANITTSTLLGVPRSALLQQSLALFVAPDDQDHYYLYRRKLVPGGRAQVCELRMLRHDQTPFWVRLETMMVPGATTETTVYRVVMSDITARVHAEDVVRELNTTLEQRVNERTAALRVSEEHLRSTNAELERALRLKDEFLAMMSHELRTPLSIVLSLSEALTEEIYGPLAEPQHKALDTITQSGQHLLALLSDILDLARIAVGRETLELQPIDVDIICQMSMLMVEPVAHAKGIQMNCMIVPGIVGLYADDRRLTQILVNLLNNAVKFTPAGGSVVLEVITDAIQEHIQFSVWDNGIGIALEDQGRIFEPFIQADARLARQYGGVGLGLALVQRLVALHGGSVHVVSAPGQGSRFTINLPWSASENVVPVASVASVASVVSIPTWVRSPHVVVADDHEPTLSLYTDLLSVYGYQVLTAQTGEDVLALVNAHRPDAMILDIQMPGMDGITTIRRIRESAAIADVPIIVLTAQAMAGDRERCLEAGANIYLTKPANLRNLLTTLTALLPASLQNVA